LLSTRSIYREMRDNDRAFQIFVSTASVGEEQGGWENERIAALTSDPQLAGRIRRHAEDEAKHGRLFHALLRKRGLDRLEVALEANYSLLLERRGIGVSHERLRSDQRLSDEEILQYLVHSRVTEQRASEEIARQCAAFCDDPEIGRAIRIVDEDERKHLAYANQELQHFSERGYAELIARMLEQYALAEVRTHRDVALCVMREVGQAIGWSRVKRGLIAFGIHGLYLYERLWDWRRMARIERPDQPDAMAPREHLHTPARTG
jgi:hypothetical protein